jgi:acetyltransferase-like isoleucine patch superfamily enzyme
MMGLAIRASLPPVLPETVGPTRAYFERRGITLDCSGPLEIHAGSHWGYLVMVFTRSHDIRKGPGQLGRAVDRGVYVGEGAWICSGAILQGCRIGAGAIVAAGTVVRGQDVAPGVMVAGNPARVIARWDATARTWAYLPMETSGFTRGLE